MTRPAASSAPQNSPSNDPDSTPIRSESLEITANEAAKRLSMTKQAVGLWAAKPGAPVRRDGTRVMCRWPDFMRWREQELVRVAVAEATTKLRAQLASSSGGSEADPIRRKLLVDATMAEMDLADRQGATVTVDAARAAFVHRLTAMRNILIAFPRTAAAKLLGAKTLQELERRLDVEIRRVMELLATPPAIGDDTEKEAA